MAHTYSFVVFSIAVAAAFTVTSVSGIREICQWETFEAKCQDDEAILIKEANYGRMKVGRCQPRDYFVGCSADVTDIMHARCSGRQHCRVPVPDPVMFAATPCPKDLVTYLQADYECIKVSKSSADKCNNQILTSMSGYISKPPTKLTDQKTVCPHRILAEPGQTINIYLYDFYTNKATHNIVRPKCIPYGSISEPSANAASQICGGDFRINQLIYRSRTNIIDLSLIMGSAHSHHYMLHYEVIGCPPLQPIVNSWVKPTAEGATRTCNNTNIAVSYVCVDNKWVGDPQNCTKSSNRPHTDSVSGKALTDILANTGVVVIICVGLALGILFGIGFLAFSVNYMKDRKTKTEQVYDIPPSSPLDRSIEFMYDTPVNKSFIPVDQYRPIYVPVTYDPYNQVPVHTVQPMPSSYVNRYTGRLPDSMYTPLYANQPAAVTNYGHQLYDLAALHHTLGRKKIASIEEIAFN